jgi:hypothetical protein
MLLKENKKNLAFSVFFIGILFFYLYFAGLNLVSTLVILLTLELLVLFKIHYNVLYLFSWTCIVLLVFSIIINKETWTIVLSQLSFVVLALAIIFNIFQHFFKVKNSFDVLNIKKRFDKVFNKIAQILSLTPKQLAESIFICMLLIALLYHFVQDFLYYQEFFYHGFLISYFKYNLGFQLIAFSVGVLVMLIAFLKKRISLLLTILIISTFLIFSLSISVFAKQHLEKTLFIYHLKPQKPLLWQQVSVYGKNFGDVQEEKSKVLINDIDHRILKWTDERIVFIAGPETKHGKVRITNNNGEVSNPLLIELKY